MLAALADHEAAALQVGVGEQATVVAGGLDEDLLDGGLGVPRDRADALVAHGDVTPADNGDALLGGDPLHHPHRVHGEHPRLRQEGQPGRVRTGGRELEVHDLPQETVRDLEQDAGAVTGVGLGAHRTAVLEVDQGRYGLVHDVPRPASVHVHHERDATRIVLVLWPVQALGAVSGAHLVALPVVTGSSMVLPGGTRSQLAWAR